MGLAEFDIVANVPGRPQILVNGEDVSGLVHSARVDLPANEVPRVTLAVLTADTHIAGEGIVYVEPPATTDGIDAVTFLEALDPSELDRAVLQGASLGSPGGAEAYLEVLRRWARGE